MAEPQIAEHVLNQQHRQAPSPFRRCLDCLRSPRQHQMRYIIHACETFMRSLFWRTLIIFCTVVLLFGSPVQFLWVPKAWDFVFDIVYSVTLGVFVVDMLFNIMVDPEYLAFDFCRPKQMFQEYQPKLWTCGVGSFMFWCDVFSTAALCHDISYINRQEYEMFQISLELDDLGIPTEETWITVNNSIPVEPDIHLLVLIFKTARVARLIPSSTVVEISSRINFYWYIERLFPSFYWRKIKEQRERARRTREEMEAKSRRSGWGGLDIAALAAAKARQTQERWRQEQESKNFLYVIIGFSRRQLRRLGFLPSTNEEIRKDIAARTIQRAWKNRLARPTEYRSEDGGGLPSVDGDAWRGRSNGTTALERVMNRRSMLSTFQRQNRSAKNGGRGPNRTNHAKDGRDDSQVGSAMAAVTGQRVATITLLSLILTVIFTYHEQDSSRASTMVVLHGQTFSSPTDDVAKKAVGAAKNSSIPGLFEYNAESDMFEKDFNFPFEVVENTEELRQREIMHIKIRDPRGTTQGQFTYRQERIDQSLVELFATVFVLVIWFLGVTAFAGPIMTLVIIPIERMVRLLGMLMNDPLGYQSNSRFRKFLFEEEAIVKKSQWTKEVLKGMETSFLMTTILRIGSLMKVGFGSAGVEIIRNNLREGQNKNMLILNSQGSTVACIFLFCDIRQFTDATECLQEEVFVFTNRIAAVVHSICHSYGGSANKNVGDAFLVSWLLEDESSSGNRSWGSTKQSLSAKHNQADKALLSVVKICMALYYDEYYVEAMTDTARNALLSKLKNRAGPIVQMGFGLHAGKAVEGAIGSQRKIDATYISEAVERAEFLESSTKQYGLKMLMSDSFHRLLHPNNRRRCRKIDQIVFQTEDEDEDPEEAYAEGDVMELFTFDMDIDSLWRNKKGPRGATDGMENLSDNDESQLLRRAGHPSARNSNVFKKATRRISMRNFEKGGHSSSDEMRSGSISVSSDAGFGGIMAAAKAAASEVAGSTFFDTDENIEASGPGELVLPTGPTLYSANAWLTRDMRIIRQRFTPDIFNNYSMGLTRYYQGDWSGARPCFEAIMERFRDGPTQYFLDQMDKHNGKPPRNFQGYGKA